MFDLFDREKYIAQLPDVSVLAVRKFRYCNIKLAVELSRKEKKKDACNSRDERVCTDCDIHEADNEFDLFFNCTSYTRSLLADELVSYLMFRAQSAARGYTRAEGDFHKEKNS